ncbi:hypothetical protein D3C76_1742020 [compost metagenome]
MSRYVTFMRRIGTVSAYFFVVMFFVCTMVLMCRLSLSTFIPMPVILPVIPFGINEIDALADLHGFNGGILAHSFQEVRRPPFQSGTIVQE